MKEKMRSWALWLAIASLIVFCVKQFSGVDLGPVVDEFMNLLLPVLVGFGIINNPNSRGSI
jgi:uncharacterized membrane protein